MSQREQNIKLATDLGLDIKWDALMPKGNASVDVDFTNAQRVPQFLLDAYKTTRGLGKRVKAESEGRLMVRTNPEDKHVYLVPVPDSTS